jgi:hypothetical protein
VRDLALTLALLLADPSSCLRLRVLTELAGRPANDPEAVELAAMRPRDPLALPLLSSTEKDGAAGRPDSREVGFALARLAYLGFDRRHPAVSRRAEHLFSLQRADGSWPLPKGRAVDSQDTERRGYDAIPLQTAIPLRGLAACGYAEDPRAERAYEWLDRLRLEDGAWPTGLAAGVFGRVGGYRRLPHSRWGCRSNTTGVLLCLAHHPLRVKAPAAARALDHLLARETRDRSEVGFEVARLVGATRTHGFITFHAAFDTALLLDLVARIGASREDERVHGLVDFVESLRNPAGLWELPSAPTASRWLSFDLSRSLAGIAGSTDWLPLSPRTPFRSYLGPRRRN